ncbi:hypothetical protein PGUG_02088 [Meyerozyma guilliermondii ATCC 6260]|uniref:Transcription initiation factor IIF subunit beta n=1 Tax=Meyerozyma guilliermondii (strain ATCC 6260 / CBS 566 / DSM 6381 / JCM 1539 / NBRC 10279 / NRRL Y-324) TaxID=294746 RepID=A5DFN7_PICGU|nr:uncharacterized protein PGUG_02088 [Meyerozyma guilliermondii ATCC 6260]EDK37990.2 hypothetical protein PGUG_02088 [Meyerozyma guilliermondii ATCC 6260]
MSSPQRVKKENGNFKLKKDESNSPGGQDHGLLSDPESYLEENESLDMNLTSGNKKIWLVKLPRYLASKWSDINALSGKELAKIKIRQGSPANGGKLQVKLVLSDQSDDSIPHEYDVPMLNTQVKNSYVFSEENLSKFKDNNGITEVLNMPDLPKLQPLKEELQFKQDMESASAPRGHSSYSNSTTGNDAGEKFVPIVKTIPKKTKLSGKICHDCQIVPSKNDRQYSKFLNRRQNIQVAKPRPRVTLLNEIPGVLQSNAGPSVRGGNASVFLKTTTVPRSKIEGRAVRMPRKDLLDLLFRLFEEYEYWSMKGLKERTRQPESFLKECLDSIAILIKKGPYTSKYSLRPEYKKLSEAERAAGLNENDGKDEDEDDLEMEDVV